MSKKIKVKPNLSVDSQEILILVLFQLQLFNKRKQINHKEKSQDLSLSVH
jgi:hypothetical protein